MKNWIVFLIGSLPLLMSGAETPYPFRYSGTNYYNVTKSTQWELIPPSTQFPDGDSAITFWKAKVIEVNSSNIVVRLSASSGSGYYEDDRHNKRVIIKNHPLQKTVTVGDSLQTEYYRRIKIVSGYAVYDFGIPYDPYKKAK